MTRPDQPASPAAVGDERLWRTNPVWCLERVLAAWGRRDHDWLHRPQRLAAVVRRLLDRGVRLPAPALRRWADDGLLPDGVTSVAPEPGVVGLVVDRRAGVAWVAPLEARRAACWSVAPNLPMRPAAVLQDLLVRLVLGLGLPQGGAVPERFAFEVSDRLGQPADGPSMHVAGLLAVLAAANDHPPLLRRACAVVQPGDGGALVPVRSVAEKLAAFVRETGTGSLLVRAAGCPDSPAFEEHFEEVWEVSSLQKLARRAERAGLLRVFVESVPLGRADLAVAREYLRALLDDGHRYAEALNLACRLQECPCLPEVPAQPIREVRRTAVDLYRHLGYYVEAEELALREAAAARGGDATSYDEHAQADVIHAAALYDPHRFDEMEAVLGPWLHRLEGDPLLVAPETRVMVFNTLARARVLRGPDGWRELFARSLEVLARRDPLDMPRTWNYLVHGLLRHGELDEAGEVLARAECHPARGDFSRWLLRFLQAEYARRRGELWTDPEMEASPGEPRRLGHPFGFYFQATALQPGRARDDVLARLRQARAFFLRDAGVSERPNILRFLADCLLLAESAWEDDAQRWQQARDLLAAHLRPRPGCRLDVYYAESWNTVGAVPDRRAAEEFLRRVPFF